MQFFLYISDVRGCYDQKFGHTLQFFNIRFPSFFSTCSMTSIKSVTLNPFNSKNKILEMLIYVCA